MLTQQLRELEKYGIISRKTYPTVPPMVEYSLTEIGKELIPIMEAMDHWGKQYVKEYHKNKMMNNFFVSYPTKKCVSY